MRQRKNLNSCSIEIRYDNEERKQEIEMAVEALKQLGFDVKDFHFFESDLKRDKIIKIIDEEDAWIHVVMNYITGVKSLGVVKKNGKLDQRSNVSRLVVKLNRAIDDMYDLDNIEWGKYT